MFTEGLINKILSANLYKIDRLYLPIIRNLDVRLIHHIIY